MPVPVLIWAALNPSWAEIIVLSYVLVVLVALRARGDVAGS